MSKLIVEEMFGEVYAQEPNTLLRIPLFGRWEKRAKGLIDARGHSVAVLVRHDYQPTYFEIDVLNKEAHTEASLQFERPAAEDLAAALLSTLVDGLSDTEKIALITRVLDRI